MSDANNSEGETKIQERQRPESIPVRGNALGTGRRETRESEARSMHGWLRRDGTGFQPFDHRLGVPKAMPWAGMGRAFGAKARHASDAGSTLPAFAPTLGWIIRRRWRCGGEDDALDGTPE
jgi:hypothetical protein